MLLGGWTGALGRLAAPPGQQWPHGTGSHLGWRAAQKEQHMQAKTEATECVFRTATPPRRIVGLAQQSRVVVMSADERRKSRRSFPISSSSCFQNPSAL